MMIIFLIKKELNYHNVQNGKSTIEFFFSDTLIRSITFTDDTKYANIIFNNVEEDKVYEYLILDEKKLTNIYYSLLNY